MVIDVLKKLFAWMGKLLGNWLLDIGKFTFCSLILSSMFNSMDKGGYTYTKFAIGVAICFLAGAILTYSKNKDNNNT